MPTIYRQTAAERNAENRRKREADDRAHAAKLRELDALTERIKQYGPINGPIARPGDSRQRQAPASTPSAASNRSAEITHRARQVVLREAIAGDRDAIDHLRTLAAWFPNSAANGHHDAMRPPPTDAQIVAAAITYLKDHHGVVVSAAGPRATAPADSWARAFARVTNPPFSGRRIK